MSKALMSRATSAWALAQWIGSAAGRKQREQGKTTPETGLPESIQDGIDERAALCAGAIPAIYVRRMGAAQPSKALRIADAEWRLALRE